MRWVSSLEPREIEYKWVYIDKKNLFPQNTRPVLIPLP